MRRKTDLEKIKARAISLLYREITKKAAGQGGQAGQAGQAGQGGKINHPFTDRLYIKAGEGGTSFDLSNQSNLSDWREFITWHIISTKELLVILDLLNPSYVFTFLKEITSLLSSKALAKALYFSWFIVDASYEQKVNPIEGISEPEQLRLLKSSGLNKMNIMRSRKLIEALPHEVNIYRAVAGKQNPSSPCIIWYDRMIDAIVNARKYNKTDEIHTFFGQIKKQDIIAAYKHKMSTSFIVNYTRVSELPDCVTYTAEQCKLLENGYLKYLREIGLLE